MEFPEGWGGSSYKAFRGRGMDIFWNNTIQAWYLMFSSKKYPYSPHRRD